MRTLLATLVALTLGVSPTLAETPTARFLRLPLSALGKSIQSLTSKLGDPQTAKFQLLPNRHEPTMRDVRANLVFDGVSATVLIALCCEKSLLESVRLDQSVGAAVLGERLPVTSAEVQDRFGVPTMRSKSALIYEIPNDVGTDTVTFGLRRGLVTSVEWKYFID